MPILSTVQTDEVRGWRGLHLLHIPVSLCCRKVAIVLRLKGLECTEHTVENMRSDWYLGINPRGLVPCLVHDGAVIIESNDILTYIEDTFPQPVLMPAAISPAVQSILDTQDRYHMAIRTLTFRYLRPVERVKEVAAAKLAAMDLEDARGVIDPGGPGQDRAAQRAFYAEARDGVTDAMVTRAVGTFMTELAPFEAAYASRPHLVGDQLTLADVAVWVDVERLIKTGGLPLAEMCPHLVAAYDRLAARIGGVRIVSC